MRFLPLLALLVLCACSRAPSDGYLSRGAISVKYSHEEGIAGRWYHDTRTITLSFSQNGWTVAHELAHAADSLELPYATVVSMMGELPLERQMHMVRAVAAEAERIGGRDAHWRALYSLCGAAGVGHPEILGRLSGLASLAKR